LIDVLQNLLRRKTLGTYYYFMHAGAFENKADSPTFTHTPNTPQKKIKKIEKPQGKTSTRPRKSKFARGEEKREKEVVELILRRRRSRRQEDDDEEEEDDEAQCILLALLTKARILCSDSL
jgi:hypothetical protein